MSIGPYTIGGGPAIPGYYIANAANRTMPVFAHIKDFNYFRMGGRNNIGDYILGIVPGFNKLKLYSNIDFDGAHSTNLTGHNIDNIITGYSTAESCAIWYNDVAILNSNSSDGRVIAALANA
jgi:hypothetical protein